MRPPVRWGEYWLPCCTVARELERPGISMSCLKDSECLNTHYVPAVQNEKQLQCWQRSMWTPVLRLPPTLGIWPSPPACCLPDPSNTTNSTPPLFHPTHIIPEKLFPPSTTSPLFHIPGGALVKSNPIIRLSAVPEKKELSPRFFSGLPFLFPPSFFTPSAGKTTLWALLASCFCLSSDLIYPFSFFCCLILSVFFMFFFVFFLIAVSTSVLGLRAPEHTHGATRLWGTTWLCCTKPHSYTRTHTHIDFWFPYTDVSNFFFTLASLQNSVGYI